MANRISDPLNRSYNPGPGFGRAPIVNPGDPLGRPVYASGFGRGSNLGGGFITESPVVLESDPLGRPTYGVSFGRGPGDRDRPRWTGRVKEKGIDPFYYTNLDIPERVTEYKVYPDAVEEPVAEALQYYKDLENVLRLIAVAAEQDDRRSPYYEDKPDAGEQWRYYNMARNRLGDAPERFPIGEAIAANEQNYLEAQDSYRTQGNFDSYAWDYLGDLESTLPQLRAVVDAAQNRDYSFYSSNYNNPDYQDLFSNEIGLGRGDGAAEGFIFARVPYPDYFAVRNANDRMYQIGLTEDQYQTALNSLRANLPLTAELQLLLNKYTDPETMRIPSMTEDVFANVPENIARASMLNYLDFKDMGVDDNILAFAMLNRPDSYGDEVGNITVNTSPNRSLAISADSTDLIPTMYHEYGHVLDFHNNPIAKPYNSYDWNTRQLYPAGVNYEPINYRDQDRWRDAIASDAEIEPPWGNFRDPNIQWVNETWLPNVGEENITSYGAYGGPKEEFAERWKYYLLDKDRGWTGRLPDGTIFRFADLYPATSKYFDDIIAGYGRSDINIPDLAR